MDEAAYKQQIERLQAKIMHLERQVHHDDLTNILNRRGLMQILEAFIGEVQFQLKNPDRRQFLSIKSFSILFLDIDFFKKINDTHGHAAGDDVLQKVADTIRTTLRGIDVVGRYGGEEIIVGLVGADSHAAKKIAEDLRTRIAELTFGGPGQEFRVTTSIGVASLEDDLGLDELIKRADQAMYEAKQSGRNNVQIYRADAA